MLTDAFDVLDERFARLAMGNVHLEKLYTGCRWAEGPACAPHQTTKPSPSVNRPLRSSASDVDEPISIYAHADWSEQDRLHAGGTTTSPERMVAGFTASAPINSLISDLKPLERSQLKDSPYFVNSQSFAIAFIKNDPRAAALYCSITS